MINTKEAFIGAKEVSQALGIGMTKAYGLIKSCNEELQKQGYFTMRGKCPRKFFEQKIYGYEDYDYLDYQEDKHEPEMAAEEVTEYANAPKEEQEPET